MSEQTQALELVTDKPQELMRRATDVAGICKEIVLKTAVQIQGRKYVKCEGWMSIATAHGCIASSRDVQKVEGGYKAIGEIRRIADGVLLAQAEGFVGMDETKTWAQRPEYACRAMAQTRAISRACRAAFAHVVVLMDAGLSTTPAEEVPDDGFEPRTPQKSQTTIAPHPEHKNAPEMTQEAKAPISVATVAHRQRLIEHLTKHGPAGLEYVQKSGMLLPTEEIRDLPLRFVPASKEQFDQFMACLQGFVDGAEAKKPDYANDELEKALGNVKQVVEQTSANRIRGMVQAVSAKPGKSKAGKPYTKIGVKIADGWLNTFDTKIGDVCTQAKASGLPVDIEYKETEFGREILSCVAVEPEDDVPM